MEHGNVFSNGALTELPAPSNKIGSHDVVMGKRKGDRDIRLYCTELQWIPLNFHSQNLREDINTDLLLSWEKDIYRVILMEYQAPVLEEIAPENKDTFIKGY